MAAVVEENYRKGEGMVVVVVVVRNNGTRNGWMDRWMHRCRLEGKSARSLTSLTRPLDYSLQQPGAERRSHGGLFLLLLLLPSAGRLLR